MAAIQRLNLWLWTSNVAGASTDGDVYLGFGGREFSIDSTADDFDADPDPESDEDRPKVQYTFGEGTNVRFPEFNDPRDPQVFSETAVQQPVYLRFAPKGRKDNWNVYGALLTINDHSGPSWDTAHLQTLDGKGIWLGTHAGLTINLALRESSILQADPMQEVIAQLRSAV